MDPRADDGDHVRLLRFLVALLLLAPALLSGYVVGRDCHAMGFILPFAAAVLAFPATLRSRTVGMALGTLSLSALDLIRISGLSWLALKSATAFELARNQIFPMLMATLAIVGFFAWARWATHEPR